MRDVARATRQQAGKAVRAAVPTRPAGVPSWGPVLATTVRLWVVRRPWRALLVLIGVLAVAAAAVGVTRLTSMSGRPARVPPSARPHQGQPAAATVPSRAAAWIAGQVGSHETVACDPVMCTALGAHGVASSRLLPLPPASAPASASGAPGATVIAVSAPVPAGLSADAPVLLASFGSGASQVQVRTAVPGGVAAYQAALGSDLAARRSAATQLLHSRRIEASAQGAGQLRAGEVDSRLLVMLAVLASQRSWRVVSFGDASPGVPLAQAPFRQLIIASAGGGGGLATALAMVRAQGVPYQPARVSTVRLAGGQAGLLIDFAAPSPLGLLSGGASG